MSAGRLLLLTHKQRRRCPRLACIDWPDARAAPARCHAAPGRRRALIGELHGGAAAAGQHAARGVGLGLVHREIVLALHLYHLVHVPALVQRRQPLRQVLVNLLVPVRAGAGQGEVEQAAGKSPRWRCERGRCSLSPQRAEVQSITPAPSQLGHDWQCNMPSHEWDDGEGYTDMEIRRKHKKRRYVDIS